MVVITRVLLSSLTKVTIFRARNLGIALKLICVDIFEPKKHARRVLFFSGGCDVTRHVTSHQVQSKFSLRLSFPRLDLQLFLTDSTHAWLLQQCTRPCILQSLALVFFLIEFCLYSSFLRCVSQIQLYYLYAQHVLLKFCHTLHVLIWELEVDATSARSHFSVDFHSFFAIQC